jgi:hypothetical protein
VRWFPGIFLRDVPEGMPGRVSGVFGELLSAGATLAFENGEGGCPCACPLFALWGNERIRNSHREVEATICATGLDTTVLLRLFAGAPGCLRTSNSLGSQLREVAEEQASWERFRMVSGH